MVRSTRARAGIGAVALGAALLVPGAAMAQDASPAASRPQRRRVQRRRVLEQLRAAPLGGHRQAEHAGHDRGRRRHVPGLRRQARQRAAADRRRDAHQRRRGRPRPARPGPGRRRRGLEVAANAEVPVIAYDRLIEDPNVLYITFDNVARRRGGGRGHPRGRADGQLRPHQGRPGRRERLHVPAPGLDEAGLQEKIDAGEIVHLRRPVHRRLEDRDGPGQHGGDHRRGQRRGRRRSMPSWPRTTARRSASSRRSRPRASTRSRSAARTATRRTCRTWPPAGSTWTCGRTATSSARSPVRPRSSSAPASPMRSADDPRRPHRCRASRPPRAWRPRPSRPRVATPSPRSSCSRRRSPQDTLNLVVDGGWIDAGRPLRAGD